MTVDNNNNNKRPRIMTDTPTQARVRFPSMLISRDGLMSPNDPLRNYKVTLADRTISAR